MFAKVSMVAVGFVVLSAMPAFAQMGCGSLPIAPVMPTPAEITAKPLAGAQSTLHDAFLDIKNWQGTLKTYRACLDDQSRQGKAQMSKLDPNKDATKIKDLTNQVEANNHIYDQSVNEEEKEVNGFHAAQAAFCMRSDSDKSTCPK